MEMTTVARALTARDRDRETGKFIDPSAAARVHAEYVRLYDPVIGGVVQRDGEGNPMSSFVTAAQVKGALAKGFTEAAPAVTKGGK